jgi:hypothetical protein
VYSSALSNCSIRVIKMPRLEPKSNPSANGRCRTKVHLRVDMPVDLHRWLKSTAAIEGLTVTAFVIALLRETQDRVREATS